MKRIFVIFLTLLACAFLFKVANAQDTEPPLGLPTIDSSTPTDDDTSYTAATVSATATASTTTQQAVDDAEVGSEIVALVVFSLVGGIGIFLIKKYFDLKSYNL